jgi:hypothetical protein
VGDGVNVEQVQQTVDDIRTLSRDSEAAHLMEDHLYTEVLASIALGNPNAKEIAAAALHAQDIQFERWYA